MRKEIRTFVAINIVPGEKLLGVLQKLKINFKDERINWVEPDNFHLTLRFIGNTTREQLYDLDDRLDEAIKTFNTFRVEINGTGYFKSKGQPRVVFVKINENQQLLKLAETVEEQVVASGFYKELKPFRPHLTLGRIKHIEKRNRFFLLLEKMADEQLQITDVNEIILYQSILKPEGPEYRAIRKFRLK